MGERQPSGQEQFVAECIAKCVHVILSARIPSPAATPGKPNRWFLTEVPELAEVRAFLEPCRGDLSTPVDLEVYCGPAGRQQQVLLERWRLVLDSTGGGGRLQAVAAVSGATHARLTASNSSSSGGSGGNARLAGDDGALYKRLTLLVRCLCCHLRVLPVHRLVRAVRVASAAACLACGGAACARGRAAVVRLSESHQPRCSDRSRPRPAPGQELRGGWAAAPAAVLGGGLRVKVDHVTPQAVAALEESVAGCPSLPAPVPVIINDYYPTSPAGTATGSGPAPPSRPNSGSGGAWARGSAQQPQPMQHQRPSPASSSSGGIAIPVGGSLPRQVGSGQVRPGGSGGDGTAAPGGTPRGISPASGGAVAAAAQAVACSLPSPAHTSRPPPGGVGSPQVARTRWGRPPQSRSPISPAIPGLGASSSSATPPPPAPASSLPATRGFSPFLAQARGAATQAEGPGIQGPGAGATAAGAAVMAMHLASVPMHIPGSSSTQPRTRSLADIHVVYNFPDNLPPVAGGGAAAAAGACSTTSGAQDIAGTTAAVVVPGSASHHQQLHHHLGASGLLMHGHGSAPAAPRGMLGQALEAHWAMQAQRSGAHAASAGTQAACASAASTSTGGDRGGSSPGILPGGSVLPTTNSQGPSSGGAGGGWPGRAGTPVGGTGGTAGGASGGAGAPAAQGHQGNGGEEAGGRSALWRVPHTPSSPQLPFAFTPSAQSLSNTSYSQLHASRFGAGTSVAASPSWGSARTPGALHHHHHQHSASQASWRPDLQAAHHHAAAGPASSSSTVISGRDVSGMALARRPSWVEHSARVGRGGSGGLSPAVAQLDLPHSLPAGALAATTPPRYGWPAATAAAATAPSSSADGTPFAATVAWTTPLAAAPAVSYLWDVHPAHLPPVLLVTVPTGGATADRLGGAQGQGWAGAAPNEPWADSGACDGLMGDDEEDLPFLMEPLAPAGCATGGWVAALLPRQAGAGGTGGARGGTPAAVAAASRLAGQRGVTAPVIGDQREAAVGLLLSHLPLPQPATAYNAAETPAPHPEPTRPTCLHGVSDAAEQGGQQGAQAAGAPVGGGVPALTCAAALEQLESLNSRLVSLLTSTPC